MTERVRILNQELVSDPNTRGYNGMNSSQITADINTEYETTSRPVLAGQELLACTDQTEFNALSQPDQQQWQLACTPGEVVTTEGAFASLEARFFPDGSKTKNTLEAMRNPPCTRAEKLGLGVVSEGEVQYSMQQTRVGQL